MIRSSLLFVAAAASVLSVSNAVIAQRVTFLSNGIKLGETFKGEFGAKHKGQAWVSRPESKLILSPDANVYIGSIPITLKAGQGMSITATVTGQDRLVGVHVLDPAGKRILNREEKAVPRPQGADPTALSEKTAEYTIEEVSAAGKYTIVVISDRVGPFTVRATGGSEEEDREALEKQLKELRWQVEEIEAKLKALDAKPKKK